MTTNSKLKTRMVHSGHKRDAYEGTSSVPIFNGSTFAQPDPDNPGGYDYSRSGNPTREALETAIAELEGGSRGLAFSSGMSATAAALFLLRSGDHLLAPEDVYGGTYRILTTLLEQWGISTTFVDMTDLAAVAKAVRPQTRMILVETPSNPLLKITDLRAVVRVAAQHGLITVIDNTFATPVLQRPLELGFDIVVHSATKFIGGHSDVIAGLVVARTAELGKRLKFIQNTAGAVLGPQDSWIVLRGLRTLSVRMAAQQQGASLIAQELVNWPQVRRVFYPGLKDHPGREINESQSEGAGAVLSFELRNKEAARRALSRVHLCLPAVSLGGVESILSYPARMSHAAMPPRERRLRGISDGLLRLSVGLEDPQDVLDDLRQALG